LKQSDEHVIDADVVISCCFAGCFKMKEYAIIFLSVSFLLLTVAAVLFNYSLRKLVKKRTKELEREKNFLSYVMEATNTSINITDAQYNLQYVDSNWQKIYGDPTGRKCYEYFMGRDKPCEVCGMPEAMEKKETIVYEEVMPNENNRVVEVHTIPFKDEDGKWLFAEFNVDITKRKRAEEALVTAQRLESLGILAGGIAHDFNNLLAGIFGNINLASGISKNKEVLDILEQTSNTIERARSLAGQLLTFAKGGVPVKKIGRLVPFIEETVKFALSGSNVSCSFKIQEDLLLSEFDRNQIGQVLDNLVINAKQAMSESGKMEIVAENITLSGNGHTQNGSGRYVKITVKDYGTGIPQDVLPKIFDPFFSTKKDGVGLGLATSYSIIKRHGGLIEVVSEIGKGSAFSIFLPATEGALHLETEAVNVEHKGTGIFVVMDDQELIRMTTGKMLETLGYAAVLKEDGESAVKYFESNRESIKGMIFDLTIPGGMDGIEAISIVRKLCDKVPVFVSSGYADDPVMAHPEKYGFTASISKPFKKEELIRVLDKHVRLS
jgi:nitrogen-specific signal transduction histidine kinase/CheY-like chemotaxis protein